MTKIVFATNTCALIKDKIVAFHVDKDDKKTLTIWLMGGFYVTNHYESEEKCRKEYECLREIMMEE